MLNLIALVMCVVTATTMKVNNRFERALWVLLVIGALMNFVCVVIALAKGVQP